MGLQAGDVILATMRGRCFGQRIIITHTYQMIGDGDALATVATDLQRFIDEIAIGGGTDWQTEYLELLPASYEQDEITAQRIAPVRSAYVSNGTPGQLGQNPSPATVANDAATITFRTQNAGRSQVSTKHIGPVPDAASAAGLIVAGYKTLLDDLARDMLFAVSPVTWLGVAAPGVYHRQNGTFDFFTDFTIGDTSRVMRRRTVGLGE